MYTHVNTRICLQDVNSSKPCRYCFGCSKLTFLSKRERLNNTEILTREKTTLLIVGLTLLPTHKWTIQRRKCKVESFLVKSADSTWDQEKILPVYFQLLSGKRCDRASCNRCTFSVCSRHLHQRTRWQLLRVQRRAWRVRGEPCLDARLLQESMH